MSVAIFIQVSRGDGRGASFGSRILFTRYGIWGWLCTELV